MKKASSPFILRIGVSASLAALITLALGLLLFFAPNTSRRLLCTFIGAGLTLYGGMNVVSFLLGRDVRAYTPELLIGVCALAFGVFSLLRPDFLLNFLFIVLGLIIAVTSIGGLKRALQLRRFGFVRWHAPMVSAAATLLLALSVVFFPTLYGNLLMRVIGLLLAIEGISDLYTIHRLSVFAKNG